jgi:hypothetical protein
MDRLPSISVSAATRCSTRALGGMEGSTASSSPHRRTRSLLFALAGLAAFCWLIYAQLHPWPVAVSELRNYCSGTLIAVSSHRSWGIAEDRWNREATYLCFPSYFSNPRDYTVVAGSNMTTTVTVSSAWWPYVLLGFTVIFGIHRLLWSGADAA